MTTIHNRLVTGPLFRQASAGDPADIPAVRDAEGITFIAAPAAPTALASCRCEDLAPALARLEKAINVLLIDVADLRRRVDGLSDSTK